MRTTTRGKASTVPGKRRIPRKATAPHTRTARLSEVAAVQRTIRADLDAHGKILADHRKWFHDLGMAIAGKPVAKARRARKRTTSRRRGVAGR